MIILIEEIENAADATLSVDFTEIIKDIHPNTPVKAQLNASSLGEYINITGKINATALLKCDRCLKEFEKTFDINLNETFVKNKLFEEYKTETELKEGSFIEELFGAEEINITDLIYQSVILNIPNSCVCDINCKGDVEMDKYLKKDISDPRLEVFKKIKIEKDN